MAHGKKVPDPETVADIVHSAVSGYESFETITPMLVEDGQDGREAGDGAGFTVYRKGEWYDVTIRPSANCKECGMPRGMHRNEEGDVFVE